MAALWIKRAHTVVTMDAAHGTLHDVDIHIEDGVVCGIGPDLHVNAGQEDRVIDGRNRVVYPGFINTHHHLYQTLTRNIPLVQDVKLFDWLIRLYEIWRELTPEAIEVSTRVGLAELLLSGCTTTTDHFYVFPASAPAEWIDIEIETAREMGVRFHPMRGSMSRSKKNGGLPPDDVVQSPARIIEDCLRVIDKFHDPAPHSMCRVVLAPCSPFSVTTDLMKESARLARQYGLRLHTHLCETRDEEQFCLDMFGKRPLAYMEDCEWVGEDVWYAHGIYFQDDEIRQLAATRTGVAHCPCSNLRLGSGICRVPELLASGVRVGLAVDGSASNDSSNYVREMQMALLVHRVGTAVDAMPARHVLEMATRHGAAIFGQPEIGRLAKGQAADLAVFRLDRVEFAGAMQDPASAILFCGAGTRADYTIVNGRVLVDGGVLTGLDEERLVSRANALTQGMMERAGLR